MPGYLTKLERIAIAGADHLMIRSLLDRQQFADPLGEAARLGISSATWPLFGLLWPSGALLAARMAARLLKPGERILEIGCGLALSSLVGHRRGADVTASDNHPLAAGFLAANLRLNALPAMKYRHGEWAIAPPADLAQPAWRPTALGRFDLIIGSDVLYDRDASAALAGFVGRHAADEAEIWIVDPERGNRPRFARALAQQGYALQEQRLDHGAHGEAPAYRGRLLVFKRG
ncbi:SAM-dependent methyltransferase [Rubrivivax sp. A210]|uniref:class I SAM-dependent methyltransferase n=1 Tax=Rubrivivax sp. A210 TaxID=2772301 RepID=UPI00191A241D|nr:SAM-dependent methyltransferase [Rubrivivax sp. A210]CAD5372011.1 SAM-dependent methyltransferase [Rubrivivax sp. A210]